MTAKQYLKQAFRLNELINSDLEELAQLKALSTSISSPNLSSEAVSGSRPQEAKFVNAILKIVDLENKINEEIDRYVDLKDEIREKVIAIENEDERLILQNRYLNFQTWERIAEDLNFTTQWVHELHKRALTTFTQVYNL